MSRSYGSLLFDPSAYRNSRLRGLASCRGSPSAQHALHDLLPPPLLPVPQCCSADPEFPGELRLRQAQFQSHSPDIQVAGNHDMVRYRSRSISLRVSDRVAHPLNHVRSNRSGHLSCCSLLSGHMCQTASPVKHDHTVLIIMPTVHPSITYAALKPSKDST